MRYCLVTLLIAILGTNAAFAQQPISPEGKFDPRISEQWSPEPAIVDPVGKSGFPSDATVLLDAKSGLTAWRNKAGNAATWALNADGSVTVVKGQGDIYTKEVFTDCQLHLEFKMPDPAVGVGQDRGNSGIFFQERYEVQVLDNYQSKTYVNGMVGSVYKQNPPLVNAAKPPGQWQTYDIIYRAPRFKADGRLDAPAVMTVFLNGVLVQDHYQLRGETFYDKHPSYTAHGPASIRLQDHWHPITFRNIWIRTL